LLALVAAPASVAAQPDPSAGWPSRPIRMILPSAAGGAGDIVSRLIAQKLSERVGQQVVVENRTGGSGVVGSVAIAKAAPDGYTFGLSSASTHAASAALTRDLPYDAVKDFASITLIGSLPIVVAAYPGLPAKSLAELVAMAKAKPGSLNNGWAATLAYLAGLVFAQRAEIELNHIPYKGSGQASIDLMEGRIQMQFGTIASILGLIRDGKLRALAVTSGQRTRALPEVPTIAEALLPGYNQSLWLGYSAPAGTPEPILRRLSREIGEILKVPAMQEAYAQHGVDVEYGTPEELSARIGGDIAAYRSVVAKAGIEQK
jgi:tripartite-type tricarboxylate transporter receptor subunit TctC